MAGRLLVHVLGRPGVVQGQQGGWGPSVLRWEVVESTLRTNGQLKTKHISTAAQVKNKSTQN